MIRFFYQCTFINVVFIFHCRSQAEAQIQDSHLDRHQFNASCCDHCFWNTSWCYSWNKPFKSETQNKTFKFKYLFFQYIGEIVFPACLCLACSSIFHFMLMWQGGKVMNLYGLWNLKKEKHHHCNNNKKNPNIAKNDIEILGVRLESK